MMARLSACRLWVFDKWLNSLNGKQTSQARSAYSYEPVGSTEGKRRLVNGLCDFVGTDSTLNADEKAAMPDAWVVPSLAAAIAVGFNLPNLVGTNQLHISREQLAQIFLGRIRLWSELAKENPSLANVQQNITVVVRADGSAVTAELTKALSAFSVEWKGKVGASSKPRWPRFDLAGEGDTGVALMIRTTPYSIGYVGMASAEMFRVSTALVANDAGHYVAPSLDGVEAAMDAFAAELAEMVKPGEKVFTLSIVDPKNSPAAYPLSMFTYIAFDAARLDCQQLRDVLYLIYWGSTDPQAAAIAQNQGFAAIRLAVRDSVLIALGSLGCEGTATQVAGSEESRNTVKSVIHQLMNAANADLRGAGTSSL
jgi:ABC-type phosphate transport system substrate-binding protein